MRMTIETYQQFGLRRMLYIVCLSVLSVGCSKIDEKMKDISEEVSRRNEGKPALSELNGDVISPLAVNIMESHIRKNKCMRETRNDYKLKEKTLKEIELFYKNNDSYESLMHLKEEMPLVCKSFKVECSVKGVVTPADDENGILSKYKVTISHIWTLDKSSAIYTVLSDIIKNNPNYDFYPSLEDSGSKWSDEKTNLEVVINKNATMSYREVDDFHCK